MNTISVSDLNKYIANILDMESLLKNIIVEGEISNFKLNSSGHIYFTLKDSLSQIPCVMFKTYADRLEFKPKDGDKVNVKCSVVVYKEGGRYQLNVVSISEAGLGELYKKFEELKKKLELKGYFDISHKKKFPAFPKCIALLTSRTGAVIEDLKSIILKRSNLSNLILYPTKVQGSDAKEDIVRNIIRANDNPKVDAIILARGGGSIEDLWPFNEEIVADAIYNSKKPIMSAVGHETDFTISDFVSDFRAATPSDAALCIVKDNKDILSYLDQVLIRFNNSITKIFDDNKNKLMNLTLKLDSLSPLKKVEKFKDRLDSLTKELNLAYKTVLDKKNNNYKLLNQKLILLNPLAIIDKGYSVTYKDKKIVKSINDVKEEDIIETRIKDGTILSKVIGEK